MHNIGCIPTPYVVLQFPFVFSMVNVSTPSVSWSVSSSSVAFIRSLMILGISFLLNTWRPGHWYRWVAGWVITLLSCSSSSSVGHDVSRHNHRLFIGGSSSDCPGVRWFVGLVGWFLGGCFVLAAAHSSVSWQCIQITRFLGSAWPLDWVCSSVCVIVIIVRVLLLCMHTPEEIDFVIFCDTLRALPSVTLTMFNYLNVIIRLLLWTDIFP